MATAPVHSDERLSDLLQRCKRGDQYAYKELYHMYAGAMFNVSLRIVGNTEDAQDVLQEGFISAFKHLNQYAGEASFGAWLKRIVINKSIDLVRRRKPDLNLAIDLEHSFDQDEGDWQETDLNVERIRKAIGSLPDGYRIILCLYLFEDFSHKVIAEKLKISEGTSKSQYARAKKKLKELIEKIPQGHEG